MAQRRRRRVDARDRAMLSWSVKDLNKEVANRVLQMAAVRERLAALGADPIGGPPQAYQKMIDDDYAVRGRTIRAAGITAN